MTNQETYIAEITFVNNVIRKNIGIISYTLSSTGKDILPKMAQILNDSGHPFNSEKGRVYLKRDGKIMALRKTTLLNSEKISIIYSEVIASQGAIRYDEVDGVVIFFRVEEHSHLYFPHVHALYAGEEIAVSLIDLRVTGSFKTRKKVRTAIKYIQENIDDLRREWNRIQNSQLPDDNPIKQI